MEDLNFLFLELFSLSLVFWLFKISLDIFVIFLWFWKSFWGSKLLGRRPWSAVWSSLLLLLAQGSSISSIYSQPEAKLSWNSDWLNTKIKSWKQSSFVFYLLQAAEFLRIFAFQILAIFLKVYVSRIKILYKFCLNKKGIPTATNYKMAKQM